MLPASPQAATQPPCRSERKQRSQDIPADGIDAAGPAPGKQRPAAAVVDLFASEDLRGPETFQIVVGLGLAGHGSDVVTQLAEDRHGDTPHAARGPGDDDRSAVGLDAVFLQGVDAERGGQPGRAEDHRLAERQAGGQRHDPLVRHADELGPTAPARGPAVVARHEHLVARGEFFAPRLPRPCLPRQRPARAGTASRRPDVRVAAKASL